MTTSEERGATPGTLDILVVEAGPGQGGHVARLLGAEPGWRIRLASDGARALDAVRRQRPDLVIGSVGPAAMPGVDGIDGHALCRALRREPGAPPLLLLTRLDTPDDMLRALDADADAVLAWPVEPDQLCEGVRRMLGEGAPAPTLALAPAERRRLRELLVSTRQAALRTEAELAQQQGALRRLCDTLALLGRISGALNHAASEAEVADALLGHLLEMPGVRGAGLCAVESGDSLRLVAARGLPDVACPDCADCSGAAPGAGVLCLPLQAGERRVGMLHLLADRVLAPEQRNLLDTAAAQAAAALARLCLVARMETQVAERTEALRSERNRLSAVVDTAGALVLLAEPGGRIEMFNRACEETLGWTAAEAIGRHCWEIVRDAEDEQAVRRLFDELHAGRMPARVPGEWRTRDGRMRSIVWTNTVLRRADGSIEYLLGTGIDVTELRGAEERLRYMSHFDTLTGLPNRQLLRERLRQMKTQAQADGVLLGFMLLRFGRMPLIREALGPQAEQGVLQQAAARLRELAGADAVGRFSEDGFALAALRRDGEELGAQARRLLAALGAPYLHEGEELHLDPCIGIATYPNDGEASDTLVRHAEAALRQAVDAVGQRYAFYRPELNRNANDRFRLETALRRALERGELALHYQPQVDLASGAIVGAEALLRWRHPERGPVSPAVFIALAEETGLILPLGEWVIRQACLQLCEWRRAGLALVPVSVNLSAHQFSEQIVNCVGRILDECGVEPALLELELTESASMADAGKSCALLAQLKGMGVGLAIDDFGTGYSNLNYLKRFPVDKLKLDQSFVRDILNDGDDLAISRAVIALAHGLRLTVVAEGVELAGQLELLAQLGCDLVQGYLFSPAVPAERFAQLLAGGTLQPAHVPI